MIGAIPVIKDRWTGVTSMEMGAFGGCISGRSDFLHWDDTIMHAARQGLFIHVYIMLFRLKMKCPYSIKVTHLMGLSPPIQPYGHD